MALAVRSAGSVRDLEQRGAGQHEEGAQPLAAAQAGIAHRLEDARLARVAARQQAIHGAFDRLGGEGKRSARTGGATTTA